MTSYIKGYYSKSIFQNSTGYNIGIFKVSDTNDESLADYIGRTITFTGYFHELNNIDDTAFYSYLRILFNSISKCNHIYLFKIHIIYIFN